MDMDSYRGDDSHQKYGTHEVTIKLQSGRYKGKVTAHINGNLSGINVLRCLDRNISEVDINFPRTEENGRYMDYQHGARKYGKVKTFLLYDNGDVLRIPVENQLEIERSVVGLEITGFIASKLEDEDETGADTIYEV